jgi:hypothetical protein
MPDFFSLPGQVTLRRVESVRSALNDVLVIATLSSFSSSLRNTLVLFQMDCLQYIFQSFSDTSSFVGLFCPRSSMVQIPVHTPSSVISYLHTIRPKEDLQVRSTVLRRTEITQAMLSSTTDREGQVSCMHGSEPTG